MKNITLKREKADLVLKNGQVLNLFTNEIINQDIAIVENKIVGLGKYDGIKEIDCTGKFLVPGLIDAHVHIESSMVTPHELSNILVRSGTTTIIADPHEMVNVKGEKALDYLIDAIKETILNIFITLPSSVPCTDFETNGAGNFDADKMAKYLSIDAVVGLGETMRYMDVIENEANMQAKLDLFKEMIIDGHAPGLDLEQIQAYKLAGVNNDHECISFEEALNKLRSGFNIFIREGSGARNLEAIVTGMIKNNIGFHNCMFCTDDKHLDDIVNEGHISYCIKKAISLGVDIFDAYKMATTNPAKVYNLKSKGALAPGYDADILILDDLKAVTIVDVIVAGKVFKPQNITSKIDNDVLNTVKIKTINIEDIQMKKESTNSVIEMIPGELITNHLIEEIPGNNYFIPNSVYNKICVIERHGKNGTIGIGPLKGFNINNGAIATTVAHDSHNIIVAGDNDSDILKAVNELELMQGGYVIVSNGVVLGRLSLPLFGLMSLDNAHTVSATTHELLNIARTLGVSEGIDPFISLSFMALPVIPSIKITNHGLFDIDNQKFVK